MPEWLLQCSLIASPIVASFGSGLTILVLDRKHKANVSTLDAIHADVKHVDDCVDDLKQRVSRIEGHLEVREHATPGLWREQRRSN